MMSASPRDSEPEIIEIFPRVSYSRRQEICSSSQYRVTFHHPAYESTRLFEIPAFDGRSGGIHYRTALLWCGIIAGCAWDGWLSESKSGERLNLDLEAVLRKPDYYFHVPPPADYSAQDHPAIPYKWPAIIKFDQSPFPHSSPPPGWRFGGSSDLPSSFVLNPSVSSMSQAVRDRDVTCRLSWYEDGIKRAHLCPRSEVEWFQRSQRPTPRPEQLGTTQSVQQLYRFGTTQCSELGTVLYRTDIAVYNIITEEIEGLSEAKIAVSEKINILKFNIF
jgi:hypothetical protein